LDLTPKHVCNQTPLKSNGSSYEAPIQTQTPNTTPTQLII